MQSTLSEHIENLYILLWIFATFILAGFMSTLHWMNTPMPTRTWGRGILAYMNGLAIAILVSLWLGDRVLSHEISIIRFSFYVLMASLGGSQFFDFIANHVLKYLEERIDKILDNNK